MDSIDKLIIVAYVIYTLLVGYARGFSDGKKRKKWDIPYLVLISVFLIVAYVLSIWPS